MSGRLRELLVIGTLLLGATAHAQSTATQQAVSTKPAAPALRLATPPRIAPAAEGQSTTLQTLPPELAQRLRQGAAAPAFRPLATKLQRLPADLGKLQAEDAGAPFRIGPGVAPVAGSNWSAAYATFGSAAGPLYLFADERFQRTGQLIGRAGISFQARAGYRYLIDCAVAEAPEFEVSLLVPGAAEQSLRQAPTAGLLSVVTPPAASAGKLALGLRALRANSAYWDWHGCEVTPLRASR